MKNKRITTLINIIAFTVLTAHFAFAESLEFRAFPVFGYTPDTDFIIGLSGLGLFSLENLRNETRPSNLMMFGSYTLNNQHMMKVEHTVFFPGNTWLMAGEAEVRKYPELFWGIGNSTSDKDEINSEYGRFLIKQKIYRQIAGDFFSGPILEWNRQYNLEFEEPLKSADIKGSGGHTSPGAGWGFLFDARDSSLVPSEGFFAEAAYMAYSKTLGADYNYSSFDMDLRKYFPLSRGKRNVFAMQLLSENSRGDVPVGEMRMLGGRQMLRGYYEGRYRDKSYLAFQSEIRVSLWKRLGGIFFAAAGNVGKNIEDIFTGDFKYTAGAGIRYMLIANNGGNLRFDYGIGENTSGFYITFGEAF